MQRKKASVMSLVLVALLVTSALLAACTAVTTAPAAAPAAGSEATEAAAEPAAAAPAGDFKPVWYAPAPHPYFEDVRKGIEAFEKDTGIAVEKEIGPDWNQDSQNQRMEALAAKGFNAFRSTRPMPAARMVSMKS
ncbi:MAG: hypothetical protein U0X20_07415 [Caldilineaceae bacterium]